MEPDIQLATNLSDSWNIQFHPVTPGIVVAFVVVILFLISSALFSGSEVAFFSLSLADKKRLDKSHKNDRRILNILEKPERLLATILTVNNFVNVGIVILSAFISNNLIIIHNAEVLEFVIQVVIITFLLLLFGEILPKIYASHVNLKFARLMVFPLQILQKVFSLVTSILLSSSSIVRNRLQKHNKKISIDEISQALELTSDHDLSEEKDILQGIVKFGNKSVAEIKKPRVDVVAIDLKLNFSEVLKIANQSAFSRIPVYNESFDNIKGILYTKDLLPHSHKGNSFKWQTLIRPPFYVPDSKKISSLLEEFQKNKVHLAIVVDEYGGTSGIVTLEDILEEIVGEISDEFDDDENLFTRLSDNTYLFDGKVLLGDFIKTVGCSDNVFDNVKGDADTLAGLILELKGEIPSKNDRILCKEFVFTIESADNRRIKQVKVKIND